MRFAVASAVAFAGASLVFATESEPHGPTAFNALAEANAKTNSLVDDEVTNHRNDRYSIRLKVGREEQTLVDVFMDTASTDLWLDPGKHFDFDSSGVHHKIAYGDGSAFVEGTIGFAQMQLAGKTIPRQAFINVTTNSKLQSPGLQGLIGLGFDDPGTYPTIGESLAKAGFSASLGKSLLSSIFDQAPDPRANRFFALSLSRLYEAKDEHSVEASLSIGEYEEEYKAVAERTKRPIYPAGNKQWTVLSDGFTFGAGGAAVEWPINQKSMAQGAGQGQKLVLLDSGTTNILAKVEVRNAIYARVPGTALVVNATNLKNTHWGADRDVWVVPCTTAVTLSAVFGGQPHPIHPLDMTELVAQVGPDGKKYMYWVGTVTNGGSITASKKDALLGASFLRNVYTSFSYGDKSGTNAAPYVQLMPLRNEWETQQDFAKNRKEALAGYVANGWTELLPADTIRVFEKREPSTKGPEVPGSGSGESHSGSQGNNSDSGKGNDTWGQTGGRPVPQFPGDNGSSGDHNGTWGQTGGRPVPQLPGANNDSCSTGSTKLISNALAEDGSSLSADGAWASKYGPAILGLLGANLVVLLVLAAFAVVNFIRGGRTTGEPRNGGGRYVPVLKRDDYKAGDSLVSGRASFDAGPTKRYNDEP
ncbi:Six-hairpin glycosidase [Mycena kentingensis (nom. inval.)]|nr:Six-hairpin glycosidase [Mycena kentingensis (nom. inval.)]